MRCIFAITRPQGNPAVPGVGSSTVRLLAIRGTTLLVRGLDVIDGTLVIDIKPYTPPYDEPRGDVKVPDWVTALKY